MSTDRRRWLHRLVALALGLALGLGVAEVVSRIWWWSHPVEIHEYTLDNPNYALLRLVTGPQRYEFVPGAEQYDLKINALGFRDREYDEDKPAGVTRILVVGDSIVQGDSASDAVPLDHVMANAMEDALNAAAGEPAYEVFSTGVAGYNVVQEVAFLKRRGLDLDPDLVVIGACLNDFAPPQEVREGDDAWQVCFYDEVFPDVLPLGPLARPALEHLYVTRYLARGLSRMGVGNERRVINLDERRTADALGELEEVGREVPIVVALFPYLFEGYTDAASDPVHRMVAEGYRESGFPVVDLVEAYRAHPHEELKADPSDHVHPNALGHQLAAAAVLRYLGEQGLLPHAAVAAAQLEHP
jgi:lysophospholipase L1-like esterase